MKQIVNPPTMGKLPEWMVIGDRLFARIDRVREMTEWQLKQLNHQPPLC